MLNWSFCVQSIDETCTTMFSFIWCWGWETEASCFVRRHSTSWATSPDLLLTDFGPCCLWYMVSYEQFLSHPSWWSVTVKIPIADSPSEVFLLTWLSPCHLRDYWNTWRTSHTFQRSIFAVTSTWMIRLINVIHFTFFLILLFSNSWFPFFFPLFACILDFFSKALRGSLSRFREYNKGL